MTEITQIFVNLPVESIPKSREFWTALGFEINEQYSDEQAICVVLKTDSVYAMMIQKSYFQTFTPRVIARNETTQVLLAISLESRDTVNTMIQTAIQKGGSRYMEPVDHGWMYYDRFEDIDGHQWEVMCYGEA